MRPHLTKIEAGKAEEVYAGEGASYVRLDSRATANVTIVDRDSGQEYYLEPGDDVIFKEFNALRASHDGVSEVDVLLWIGDERSSASSAKVAGTVNLSSMPADYYSRALNGNEFMGGEWATYSNYAHCQLWNPAGSGVNLLVHNIIGSSDKDWSLDVASHVSALVGGTTYPIANKYLGGAASAAAINSQGFATMQGTALYDRVISSNELKIEKDLLLSKNAGFVVPPGMGLSVRCTVIVANMSCFFEWTEVAA